MQPGQRPDAIDTRLVLRIYAWVVTTLGVVLMEGSLLLHLNIDLDLPGIPYGRVGAVRLAGTSLAALGFTAIGLARIESPVDRYRALKWFAIGHTVPGLVFLGASSAIFDLYLPPAVPWIPLVVGLVLLYIALTSTRVPTFEHPFTSLRLEGPVLMEKRRMEGDVELLRSQYEQQIRQAARAEERTRLARDLHDAVKQQLFAIQTSAATAQARLESDAAGTRTALDQVRSAARDAMTEMEALIGQLQSPPMENTGLVDALRQQCDALALRTGANVRFETSALPPSGALPPGAQQALFRAAQEALANIGRHARATSVTVGLATIGDSVELTIHDNGAGFDPATVTPGMGTENIKARIGEVGGRLLLHSKPGRGTTIAFSIPVDVNPPRHYAVRAAAWSAVLILMLMSAIYGDAWERPWNIVIALVSGVTVARYVVAWSRVRQRVEAVA